MRRRLARAYAAWLVQTWGLGPAILLRGSLRQRWAMVKILIVGLLR